MCCVLSAPQPKSAAFQPLKLAFQLARKSLYCSSDVPQRRVIESPTKYTSICPALRLARSCSCASFELLSVRGVATSARSIGDRPATSADSQSADVRVHGIDCSGVARWL